VEVGIYKNPKNSFVVRELHSVGEMNQERNETFLYVRLIPTEDGEEAFAHGEVSNSKTTSMVGWALLGQEATGVQTEKGREILRKN
ncbi:hypothetical protein L9F63_004603, partial [Diploptera punctata]